MDDFWGVNPLEKLEEKIVKKKIPKVNVWELLKAITQDKNVDSINYNERDFRMLLIFMSYNIELVSYAALAEKWIKTYTTKHVIKMLEKMIPRKFYRINYSRIKNSKNIEILNHIKEYFNVNETEALFYLNIFEKKNLMEELKDFFHEGV